MTAEKRLAAALMGTANAVYPEADRQYEWWTTPNDLAAQLLAADPDLAADIELGEAWRAAEAALPEGWVAASDSG